MNKRSYYKRLFITLICLGFTTQGTGCKKENSPSAEPLNWSADFESGAATDVHRREDGAIGFSIPDEPGKEYLWFYFTIQDTGEQPLEFALENAFDAHQTGSRWNISRPVFSTDGQTWVKAEKPRYPVWKHKLWKRGITASGKPEFRFQAPFRAKTLWVAYSYPYTSDNLNRFLETVRGEPGVTIASIGQTEEKREIVNINLKPTSSLSDENAVQTIWIIAREHPGETPSSFVCEGMIEALLTTKAGKRLREIYAFTIIPLLNVDGVAHGYYYHNINGVNLALDWGKFDAVETRVLKDAIIQDIENRTLRLLVNLHSSNDPGLGHFFLNMPESELNSEDIDFQRNIFRSASGTHAQLQGISTITLWNIPGITGKFLYKHHNVYCLYLESNYSRGADGSVVTSESLRETGAALIETLSRVLLQGD